MFVAGATELEGCGVTDHRARAAAYLERAAELRALADQLPSENHKHLLRNSAEHYEKMAEVEGLAAERQTRPRST